ncbi:hypothetical protein CE91St32_16500 [Gordonibacter pamelaeae]|nr:hypothetical protein CE91St32_16500 [Gordonibacter pamelaeae]
MPTIAFARSTPSADRSENPMTAPSIPRCKPFMPCGRRSTNAFRYARSGAVLDEAALVRAEREPALPEPEATEPTMPRALRRARPPARAPYRRAAACRLPRRYDSSPS